MFKWNEADLEARLCRALDIANKTIRYFAQEGYTDKESPVYGFGPEKPIAETAMLLYAASARPHQPREITDRIEAIAHTLQQHARSERVLIDIALHPSLAFKFAVPHILLTKLGYPDERFDRFLVTCAAAQASGGRDRPPSAAVERRWISSLWNGHEDASGWRRDLRDSVLNRPLDILSGLRDDVYAFTHLMLYVTGFGFRVQPLPRSRKVILAEAGSLLARYLDMEDYDLAGEILLAWPLIGSPWNVAAAFGFRVLANVEDEVGVLPCGNVNVDRLRALDGEARSRYALGISYHTAYVMGFLSAACLRPGRAPPTRIAGPTQARIRPHRILDRISDDQGHWQSVFDKLSDHEQQALIPFLRDVALIQSCRRHDYEGMRQILKTAAELDITPSPASVQAIELLARIAHCASVIGARVPPASTPPASTNEEREKKTGVG